MSAMPVTPDLPGWATKGYAYCGVGEAATGDCRPGCRGRVRGSFPRSVSHGRGDGGKSRANGEWPAGRVGVGRCPGPCATGDTHVQGTIGRAFDIAVPLHRQRPGPTQSRERTPAAGVIPRSTHGRGRLLQVRERLSDVAEGELAVGVVDQDRVRLAAVIVDR